MSTDPSSFTPDAPLPTRRPWTPTRLLLAVGLAGAAGAVGYAWHGQAADPPGSAPGATEASRPAPKRVVVAEVSEQEAHRSRRFSGVLSAGEHASLSFTLPGRITSRPVQVGDRVAAGDVLATLDRKPLRNQVASARASRVELETRRDQATRDLRRTEALVESASVAEVQGERSRSASQALDAGLAAADASLAESRRQLAESTLRAPFDGTVSAVGLEAGEYASPGVPVVQLVGEASLELIVEVSEGAVLELAPGQAVTVELAMRRGSHAGARIEGRVEALAPAPPGVGRLFPVRVAVPTGEGRMPGMTAELVLDRPVASRLCVPIDAVINPGGQRPSVFVVREGRAARIEVEVVEVLEGRAFVAGALRAGEPVVVGGFAGLAEGVDVEVAS